MTKLSTGKQEDILEFQKHMENEFPEIDFEKTKKLKYNVDNSGKLDESEEYLTWILSNENKQIKITGKELRLIHDGEIYNTFEDFMKDVNLVLNGLNSYDLKIVESIGLRFINQFEISDENLIDEYFNPNLHLKMNEFSKEEFVEFLTKTDLIIDEYDLILKYGRFNPDYPNRTSKKDVILDYDCILNYDEEFEYVPIHLAKMHKIISDKFENDIKDKLKDIMR